MAANFSNTYIFNTHIENICSVLSDVGFGYAINLTFVSRCPIQNGMKFCFRNDVNFSSWGENIDVDVFYISETSSQVIIKSECAMPTQIVDWGKNKQNVNKFYNQLASVFAANPNGAAMPTAPQTVAAPPASPRPVAPQQQMQPPVQQPTVQPRFCQKCGSPLTAGAKFCQKCGNKIF